MLLMLAAMAPIASMAQEEKSAAEYKNEGNAAVTEKKYDVALESYQKAIELWDAESIEPATVYNAADCAKKLSKNDVAIELYNKSIELGYKADMSTYYIAEIYGKEGKTEERIALLEEAVQKYTEGKAAAFLKKGLVKEYNAKGMAPYKEGSTILNERATAKPEQYKEIEGRAAAKFQEAKEWFNKTLTVDAENANAQKILADIETKLK